MGGNLFKIFYLKNWYFYFLEIGVYCDKVNIRFAYNKFDWIFIKYQIHFRQGW